MAISSSRRFLHRSAAGIIGVWKGGRKPKQSGVDDRLLRYTVISRKAQSPKQSNFCTEKGRTLLFSPPSFSKRNEGGRGPFCVFPFSFGCEWKWAGRILGHGGGRQEGGRKWAGRGDSDFFCTRGPFLLQEGGGFCKIAKKSKKSTFQGREKIKICVMLHLGGTFL